MLHFFLLHFWGSVLMRSPGMRGIVWWCFKMHKDVAAAPSQNWESPPFSQKGWHRWWLINQLQVNVAQEVVPVIRRTWNPQISAQTKPAGGKINNPFCLNDNFHGYHLAAFRVGFDVFASGSMVFFPKNWLELEVHSPFVALSVGLGRIWELGLLQQTWKPSAPV